MPEVGEVVLETVEGRGGDEHGEVVGSLVAEDGVLLVWATLV